MSKAITSSQNRSNTMLAEGLISRKAYEIDLNRLDEGFLSDTIMCYATTVNEAKKTLLHQVRHDDWKLKYSGEELTYLNIPVVRRKCSDKIIFDGEEKTKHQIERIIKERERVSKIHQILSDENVVYCYIKKGSYYRPNSCGYTDHKIFAGIYSKKEAASHALSCQEITIIPIDISEHNKMIKEEIDDLSSRLL